MAGDSAMGEALAVAVDSGEVLCRELEGILVMVEAPVGGASILHGDLERLIVPLTP